MDTTAPPPPARCNAYWSFQGSKDSSKNAKYDYTHVTMGVKRCGFYAIRCARFFPPPPRVRPQICRQPVARSHGFTFHACPPTAVAHVAHTSPKAPGHGQQKCPVTTTGADITAALPDCICVHCGPRNHDQRRTAAFNRMLLTNEYQRVGKRIQIRMFYSKFEFSNFV